MSIARNDRTFENKWWKREKYRKIADRWCIDLIRHPEPRYPERSHARVKTKTSSQPYLRSTARGFVISYSCTSKARETYVEWPVNIFAVLTTLPRTGERGEKGKRNLRATRHPFVPRSLGWIPRYVSRVSTGTCKFKLVQRSTILREEKFYRMEKMCVVRERGLFRVESRRNRKLVLLLH